MRTPACGNGAPHSSRPAAERDRLARFVRDDIIEAGFAAMRGFLRGERGGSVAARGPPRTIAAGEGVDGVEIVLTRYGGPEVLEPRRVRIRQPGAGEARIRQTAVGVNFIDVYCRSGRFDLVAPGGVPGMEAAGVVESVGPNVANVRPGRSCCLRLRSAGRLCFNAGHARPASWCACRNSSATRAPRRCC